MDTSSVHPHYHQGLKNKPTASLQTGKTRTANECPDIALNNLIGEVPVILELWRMRSTPKLPSLQRSRWPRVVAPDRVLPIDQIEQFDY